MFTIRQIQFRLVFSLMPRMLGELLDFRGREKKDR